MAETGSIVRRGVVCESRTLVFSPIDVQGPPPFRILGEWQPTIASRRIFHAALCLGEQRINPVNALHGPAIFSIHHLFGGGVITRGRVIGIMKPRR